MTFEENLANAISKKATKQLVDLINSKVDHVETSTVSIIDNGDDTITITWT